jgi:hypothetical protein
LRCPKESTLVMCSIGREVELFDLIAQLILEEMEDGKLPKLTALQLLERLERLYFRLHEYTTTEDNWLY